MKRLLALAAASGLALFLSSCTNSGYYGGGYSSRGYNSGYGSSASIGIIRTSNSYWGYDPYRRSYYDYRSNRYYDHHNKRYYSSTPRRYTKAVYPSNYRRGSTMNAPSSLAKVRSSSRSSQNAYRSNRVTNSVHPNQRNTNYRRPSSASSSSYRRPSSSSDARQRYTRTSTGGSRSPSSTRTSTRQQAPRTTTTSRSTAQPRVQPASSSRQSRGSSSRSTTRSGSQGSGRRSIR